MQLTIAQPDLAKALSTVARAVPSRSPLPVLTNVLLDASDDKLTVTANNLEMAITTTAPCHVESAGKLLVPSKLLGEFVNSLPNQPVKIVAKETAAHLTCGASRAKINGAVPDDFPPVMVADYKMVTTIGAEVLRHAINQVVFAALADASRPTLNGVLFWGHDGMLVLDAADGFRLNERVIPGVRGELYALVHADNVRELAQLLAKATGDVAISVAPNNTGIAFRVGNTTLVSRLIEGKFPNFRQIIPNECKARITVNTAQLLNAAKQAGLFAREASNIVRLAIVDGRLRLASAASQSGDAENDLDVDLAGDEMPTFALNYRYLADAIGAIDAERVALGVNHRTSPVLIRPVCADDELFTQVVMTMYLNEDEARTREKLKAAAAPAGTDAAQAAEAVKA